MHGKSGGAPAPDLQSILATLAQYSAIPLVPTEPNTPEVRHETPAYIEDAAAGAAAVGRAQMKPPEDKAYDPRARPQGRSAVASPRPMIDPATITVWQEGLRCITKMAAHNQNFAASIKRMMKDQRAHEMRWYSERQNLKQTQANRSVSAVKAQSILKTLNTTFYGSPPEVDTPEVDKEKELAEFDLKIYSAQVAMEAAMTSELKSLGVPFFGTDQSLIVPDDYDVAKEQLPEPYPKWSPLVKESQFLEMRRRMVGHLEDLYRD